MFKIINKSRFGINKIKIYNNNSKKFFKRVFKLDYKEILVNLIL
jgi:hypothetical protein